MSNTQSTKRRSGEMSPGTAALAIGALLLVLLWISLGGSMSQWAYDNHYFTTDAAFTFPGAAIPGTGPSSITLFGFALLIASAVAAVLRIAFWRKVSNVTAALAKDPDFRRPVPGVTGIVVAVTAGTAGILVLIVIWTGAPWPLTLLIAAGGAYCAGKPLRDLLERRRAIAVIIHRAEHALLPYLGYGQLPHRCALKVTAWQDEDPTKAQTAQLRYTGRREKLPQELSERVDAVFGAHYDLTFGVDDQIITATATTVEVEAAEVVRLRELLTAPELFGGGAVAKEIEVSPAGDVVRFAVSHKISAKLAASSRPKLIENRLTELLQGRWRALTWDHAHDFAKFEQRPELPKMLEHPPRKIVTSIAEAAAAYGERNIVYAVDEDRGEISWDPVINPHTLIMGPTGTGKTASIHTLITEASALGYQIVLIDFKGIEYTEYAHWPNVVSIVTEPWEAVAMIHTLYREMMRRYAKQKVNTAYLKTQAPYLIVFDEYTEMDLAINEFYIAHKPKGGKKDPPTMEEIGTLLRKARSARMHVVSGLQRADVTIMAGEKRDNYTNRISLGKLSQQGAGMMWESPFVGRTIPPSIRGRGNARNEHGEPVEVQVFYTPKPGPGLDAAQQKILDGLRPQHSLYERIVVQPPEEDPMTSDEPFSFYQRLPILSAEEYPEHDMFSPNFVAPEWAGGSDDDASGEGLVTHRRDGKPRACRDCENVPPRTQGLSEEGLCVDCYIRNDENGTLGDWPTVDKPESTSKIASIQGELERLDLYESGLGEPYDIPAREVVPGTYFLVDEATDTWGIVEEEPIDSDEGMSIIWRDTADGSRHELIIASEELITMRDEPADNL